MPKKRMSDIARSSKFGVRITANDNILNVENESRCGHRHALSVQDEHTSWIQASCQRKVRRMVKNLFFAGPEARKNFHRQFERVRESVSRSKMES